MGGVGAIVIKQTAGADPLDTREAVGVGALGQLGRPERRRRVIAADGSRAGAAVAADETVGAVVVRAEIAYALAAVEPRLQGDGHAPQEVAPHVGEEGALLVVVFGLAAAGARHRVVVEAVRIERGAGRAIGHGDAVGPQVEDIVEGHGHARAPRAGVGKVAALEVAAVVAGARIAGAGLGFPHWSVVPPAQRGQVGLILAVAAGVATDEVAHGRGAASREGRVISGQYAADIEGERLAKIILLEARSLDRE